MNGFVRHLFLFVFLTSAFCASAQNKEALQKQKKQLQSEISFANKLLSKTRSDQQYSMTQAQTLQQKIGIREELLLTLDQELDMLNREIEIQQEAVDSLQARMEELKTHYAQLIRQSYKSKSKYSKLMFLLSSGTFDQAYKRIKYMKQCSAFRRKQAQKIEKQQEVLAGQLDLLKQQKDHKESLKEEKELEREKLKVEKKDHEKVVASLESKENEILKSIKKKRKEAAKLEKAIQRIIAEEIRRAKEAALRKSLEDEARSLGLVKGKDFNSKTSNRKLKRLIRGKKGSEAAAGSSSAAFALTPEAAKLAAEFTANKGKLPWPVEKGLIISKFGKQKHHIARQVTITKNGIDIATEPETKARAVFEGVVSGVLIIPGAGQTIMIRHGNYFTIYNHLKDVYVKKGDKIKTKQEIGMIYTDETEGKTILEFQLWNNDQVQNPEPWLFRKN